MAQAEFIEHTTLAGERWDLVAWTYYGDATLYRGIVMANPAVAIEPVFEAGIVLKVPLLQQSAVMTTNLPPWKRQS
ncbi:MAG TPA: tail protein X [Candidatus Binataceae bacterium]|nr:tail protein X [Candidatus Binataceae bacterium]